MLRWFYVAMRLLLEASAARRDARVRFLKAEVEILRRKLAGNGVIPSPATAPGCWRSARNSAIASRASSASSRRR
jgi:hypothetical protein